MVTQIFVEGFELDLTTDIACELNYVIDDVKDFGSKNTSYSKTIVIQGTQRNNKIFNHISELGRFIAIENINPNGANVNENYTAASGSQCSILVDNIQIFKGKIRLLEIKKYANHIEYECAVFGELGGFYFELNKGGNGALKRRLQDLNLNDLDHTWTLTNIQNSWINRDTNPGVGYYYPLIDYGNASPVANKLDFDINTFRPAIYAKELVDRMFIAAGYTYDSSFFTSELFKRLIIPNNTERLYTPTNTLINANGSYSTTSTITSFRIPYSNQFILDSQFTDVSGAHTQFKYTGTSTINTNIQVPFNLNVNGVNGQVSVELQINGVIKDVKYYSYYNFIQNISSQLNYSGQLVTNDIIQVNVSILFASLYTFDASSSLYLTAELQRLQIANFSLSPKLVASAYVPQNISCADFFTSLLKMFNLYVVEDKNIPKKLIIEPYIDFYTNETIDWTDKLDRSQELSLKPMGELNHRYYKFKYKEDNDYWNELYKKKYNETYGDWTWDTEFEFAQDETSLDVIFSPTVSYSPNNADKHVAAIYKLDSNNVETNMSSNIRILQTKNITVPTWHIKNGGNILTTTNFPYAGMFDEPSNPTNTLGWEVPREVFYSFQGNSIMTGLFNAFWSQYFAEISDPNSVILTASFWLTMMDIRTLDFSKNILIDGTIWRINKIDNYNPLLNAPTKVELLKVIDNTFDYNQYVAGYKDRLNLAGAFYEGEACLVNKINKLEII
jgi:hypothetical protein